MTDIIIPTLIKGHYTWNDNDNCLEFVSDSFNETRVKRRRNQNTTAGPRVPTRAKYEFSGFNLQSRGLPSVRGDAKTIGPPRSSPKLAVSNQSGDIVTLNNVKDVALDHLIEELDQSKGSVSSSFRKLENTREFDDFLLALLQYFTCFFDQLEQELKPQKTSFLEPSKAELKALADTKKRMEVTRRRLAQSYCVLILGLGIQDQHHMGCGKKRVSNTHRDKKMYEDLYLFCTYVVWITFRRKEFDLVKIEVGNMLRSEVFNPALKQKIKSSITAEAKKENMMKIKQEPAKPLREPTKADPNAPGQRARELLAVRLPKLERLTPAQHRRMKGNAPAIGTSVNQRSTVLVSLLPLPKEESDYLFHSLVGDNGKMEPRNPGMEDFASHIYVSQKIGIIGEQADFFNMSNLMPKCLDNEEDEESNDGANTRESNVSTDSERRSSRQADAISRVTTAEKR